MNGLVLHAIKFPAIMMVMYTRLLRPPERSFFLLGPRGTGKSTWLREHFPTARTYNLLLDREWLRLQKEPLAFRGEVDALPNGSWVVIDEVQRLPSLLNEVHDILSLNERRVRFALTGSSARKLRSNDVNLLAGRAISRSFFPLCFAELQPTESQVESVLKFGLLPSVLNAENDIDKIDILEAYQETYLTQEIRAESLVRRLDSFVAFLGVAALMNGQVTNVSSIARDAGVTRPTVQGFFELLQDTLLSHLLPAFKPKARVKEVQHPKFYLFDSGVVRSLAGRLREPLESTERGTLLETWLLHELRCHVHYANIGGKLSYWRTHDDVEVDFVYSTAKSHVGIEVKASHRFRSEDTKGLKALHESIGLKRQILVYLGQTAQRHGDIEVLPLFSFLSQLHAGTLLGR